MTLEKQTAEAEEVEQMSVADFEAKQKYRDKILEALKKREQEIQQRIESGNLTQDDGTILLEAARRDVNQKLQALDQAWGSQDERQEKILTRTFGLKPKP